MSRQKPSRSSKTPGAAPPKTFGELVVAGSSEGPTAGIVGGRIVAARKRRSMNQSDLARAAGLSRTVVNGYEKGRHLPGTRELALMCNALTTSPNELLYGVADPFADQADAWTLGPTVISVMALVGMLEQNEREAVMTLLRSLVEYRHGRQSVELIDKLRPAMMELMEQAGPELIRGLEKTPIGPSMRALIAEAERSDSTSPGKRSHKAPQRRSGARKR